MTDPRPPRVTVSFVDSYCATYKQLFSQVRSYESFRDLHLGIISDIKRKTLPEIAVAVGRENQQGLHHFLSKSLWSVVELTQQRLKTVQLGKTSGELEKILAENPEWDEKLGWKNLLNNLRLIGEPFIYSNRIKMWLKVFPIPQLEWGLLQLIALMNVFGKHLYLPPRVEDFYFSSA